MCKRCKTDRVIVRKPGGVDACPDCARAAEEAYKAWLITKAKETRDAG